MKNLHLMPMNSTFDDDYVTEINRICSEKENLFVHRVQREKLIGIHNSIVAPEWFNPDYLNRYGSEYDQIFFHSLFLSTQDLLKLSDDTARRIIWCVWGHDLYSIKKRKDWSFQIAVHEAIHTVKKIIRGTYLKTHREKKAVRKKIAQFRAICIGYPYDEIMIRKKYGDQVPVRIAPYFSDFSKTDLMDLRDYRRRSKTTHTKNILIGHSGFEFLEHEKYLELLAKYKDKDICINMVLSYGASLEKISYLTEKANAIFGANKVNVVTEMMSKEDYFRFLSKMDIAVFPYLHQSALDNTKVMAFVGTKLYFHPKGILYKGFSDSGVQVFDCREIGKVSFEELCSMEYYDVSDSPLFDTFNYSKNVKSWKSVLCNS